MCFWRRNSISVRWWHKFRNTYLFHNRTGSTEHCVNEDLPPKLHRAPLSTCFQCTSIYVYNVVIIRGITVCFFLGRREGGKVLDLSVPTPVISPNVVILGIPFFFFLPCGSVWNIASSNERWRSSRLGVRWRAAGKQADHLRSLSKVSDSTEPCWISYSKHVRLIDRAGAMGTRLLNILCWWFCDRLWVWQ